jgi:hypothetical protein
LPAMSCPGWPSRSCGKRTDRWRRGITRKVGRGKATRRELITLALP